MDRHVQIRSDFSKIAAEGFTNPGVLKGVGIKSFERF